MALDGSDDKYQCVNVMECSLSKNSLSKYGYLALCPTGERQQVGQAKVGHVTRERLQSVGAAEPGGFWNLEEL